ncbi:TPA: DUF551 domain-containing protein [Serratia marcescens]|nr:DUF551 domain-containing protein [Serratia marcescens]
MKPEPVAFRVGERLFSSMLAAGLYASEMRLTVEPLYLEEPKYQVTTEGWVECSEHMPKDHEPVLTWNGICKRVQYTMYGYWQCWQPKNITHWMPLPNAPHKDKQHE